MDRIRPAPGPAAKACLSEFLKSQPDLILSIQDKRTVLNKRLENRLTFQKQHARLISAGIPNLKCAVARQMHAAPAGKLRLFGR